MGDILTLAAVLLPVVSGLVELIKHTVPLPNRYVPLLSFLVGLVVGVLSSSFRDDSLFLRLWSGGIAGLSSTGLFNLIKRSGELKRPRPKK